MSSFNEKVSLYEAQLRDWLSKCPECQLLPQVPLHARKGTAMVQVGQSFEFDTRLGAYQNPPNRIFANRLVQYNGKIKNPIIFWVNSSFPKDSVYHFHEHPVVHHVLHIGSGYTFASLQEGVKTALKAENVNTEKLRDWELKNWK